MLKSKTNKFNRTGLILVSTLIVYSMLISAASAGTATLSWSAPTTNSDGSQLSDLAGYKVYYGTSSKSYSASVSVGKVTSYTTSNLPDGTYYFTVTALDTSNNESGYSNEVSKSIATADTTPPTGSLSVNSGAAYTTSTAVTLTLSATDLNGVSQMCISNTSSCSSWITYATSKSWTLSSGDGAKTVYASFKDPSGNISSAYSKSIVLDTVAPSVTISAVVSPTGSDSQTIKGTVGSGASVYISTDTSASDGAATVSSTSWSYTVTGLAAGVNKITATAKDSAGNSSTATTSITLNSPLFTSTSPASGAVVNTKTIGYALGRTATGGSVTFTRTGGSADPTSSHVYNFTASDITAGTHSINTGFNLVSGAIYSIAFSAVDSSGYKDGVTNSNVTYDAAAASVTINSPASNSVISNAAVGYALSENISAGEIVFTGDDGISPHIYTMASSDRTAGTHSIDTGALLLDGVYYTMTFQNVKDQVGNLTTAVSNTNIKFDNAAVVISSTTPKSGTTLRSATVGYSLSEQASNGKVTFTRTGGKYDGKSPQVYNFNADDLAAGAHTVSTNLPLVKGAIYTVSFDATDLLGNKATTVSNAGVTYRGR